MPFVVDLNARTVTPVAHPFMDGTVEDTRRLADIIQWYRGNPMSRYIWVTEVIDKDQTELPTEEQALRALVLIDATSHPDADDFLVIHIPEALIDQRWDPKDPFEETRFVVREPGEPSFARLMR